jgi:DNA-binding transcriptional LysR family regulator
MDLTQLRYFSIIAECGSMSAAARKLRVSQPTLTVAIQNLEERLKTTLFLRDSRGVSLTGTGEVLMGCIGEMFALVERTEQTILGLETDDVGEFTIGCHESLGAYFLPTFMREFLGQAPRIDLKIHNQSSEEIREAVVRREIHFGLIVNPIPHPDLVLVELFHDAVELIVSADETAVTTLEDAKARVEAGPLIFAGRVLQCQEIIQRIASESFLPERLLSVGDFELVKALVLAGLGVAVMPRRVAEYNQEGRLRPLFAGLPSVPDQIFLIYRGDFHRTKAALKVKDALVAYGRRLESET